MNKRIGIIIFAGLLMSAITFAQDCTGCLTGAKRDCSNCHNFTFYTPGGDPGCYDCPNQYLTVVGPQLPFQERVKRGMVVFVAGKITGQQMPLNKNWMTIKMPTTHDIDAMEAREKMKRCASKKISTQ